MPRIRRIAPEGVAQHVVNRGNDRKGVFKKKGDYLAFLRFMREAQDRIPVRILAYCLMPNHFHLVVWPTSVTELSAYMCRLMNLQIRNYHQHYGTCGHGHIWQGRFKNFPIQHDHHLLNVLRYVEANALRASLVRRAEDWSWSSLVRFSGPDVTTTEAPTGVNDRPTLAGWPIARPSDWCDYVNTIPAKEELEQMRWSARRGTPYGENGWVEKTAKESGLESTVRPVGRPPRLDGSLVDR
jgi:putative transposase